MLSAHRDPSSKAETPAQPAIHASVTLSLRTPRAAHLMPRNRGNARMTDGAPNARSGPRGLDDLLLVRRIPAREMVPARRRTNKDGDP